MGQTATGCTDLGLGPSQPSRSFGRPSHKLIWLCQCREAWEKPVCPPSVSGLGGAAWQPHLLSHLRLWQKATRSPRKLRMEAPAHQMGSGWLWLPLGLGVVTVV